MNNEVETLKARYAKAIEDGRKISVFTNIPEWNWYVDNVLNPTIEDYTKRIISGQSATDKEDWILRGMVQGLTLVVSTTDAFKSRADKARKDAKELQESLDE